VTSFLILVYMYLNGVNADPSKGIPQLRLSYQWLPPVLLNQVCKMKCMGSQMCIE
jgi:hypothetical protein